ncbi:MAG TPA: hypothetical protein PLS49_08340 [Candidatus Woesebacteria bacterium]|nr:hypothetical protein [Candidatus Woesebacteria bacterium]
MLNLGGELVIEIPDRLLNPYIDLLKEYHAAHPEEPFGTLQEPKPEGSGMYPPRYFPGLHEMILMLKSVGMEIDFHLDESKNTDVQSYIIGPEDPNTGEKEMHIREYFITARKSKD